MITNLIKFTEIDVDGCGSNVSELVLVRSEMLLTNGTRSRLEQAVESIWKEYVDNEECFDTETIVSEACTKVFGNTDDWEIVSPEFEIEF